MMISCGDVMVVVVIGVSGLDPEYMLCFGLSGLDPDGPWGGGAVRAISGEG